MADGSSNSSTKKSEQFTSEGTGFGFYSTGENNKFYLQPPPVEVLFSEGSSSKARTMELVNVDGGLRFFKGCVSTYDVFGLSNSDLIPGKYEGGLKLWEGSLDLVRVLHSQIQNGQLSLNGKKILELGCGHGLPGIFTCFEGASVVHFQDYNAEVLRCLTIPNVRANLHSGLPQQLHSDTKHVVEYQFPQLRFFAGDWSDVHSLLQGHGNEEATLCGGYDVILMAETVYEVSAFSSLYGLIKKCLSCPSGIVYMSAKKHYFGVGGGTRQFQCLVEEDGAMESTLISEVADGSSNVREVWNFTYPTTYQCQLS